MGPRRELDEAAASRQLTASNATLNRFLGQSHTRRISWLHGGVGSTTSSTRPPTNQAPPPQRSTTLNVNAAEVVRRPVEGGGSPPKFHSPRVPDSEATNSPPQPAVGSISPLPVLASRSSSSPVVTKQVGRSVNTYTAQVSDDSRKRKKTDGQSQRGHAKRMSSGLANSTSSEPNSTRASKGVPSDGGMSMNMMNLEIASSNDRLGLMEASSQRQQDSDLAQLGQQAQQAVEADSSLPATNLHGPCPSSRLKILKDAPIVPGHSSSVQHSPTWLPSQPHAPTVRRNASSAHFTPTKCRPSQTVQAAQNLALRRTPVTSPVAGSSSTPPFVQPQYSHPGSASVGANILPHSMNRITTQSPIIPSSPQRAKGLLPIIQPYSSENCVVKIEQFRMQRLQETVDPSNGVEYSRTEMLYQAAKADDSLFLFIHQVVSQAAINVNAIPSILRNAHGFHMAINLLNNLLAGDNIKSPRLLGFYATLPCSLTYLAIEGPSSYQLLLDYVQRLMSSVHEHWLTLKHSCIRRGYPPLATELWALNICSPALMDVSFLAITRQIWALEHPNYKHGTHEHAKKIFDENKQTLYSSLQGWVLPPASLENIQSVFHQKFQIMSQQVALRHREHARRPSIHVAAASPMIPAGTPSHTVSVSPQVGVMQLPGPFGQLGSRSGRILPSSPIQRERAPVQSMQRNMNLFLPAEGAPSPSLPATATWELAALHQAHLRDPRFAVSSDSKDDLLYQSVQSFAVRPTRLRGDQLFQTYEMTLPVEVTIARTVDTQDGQRKLRYLKEGSLQYRLRIVKVGLPPADSSQKQLESEWVLKATSWPLHFYYQLNGNELEPRRKLHHTKDLPIDVTEFVHSDGSANKLDIIANISNEDGPTLIPQYAFAIEVIVVQSLKSIIDCCLGRIVSSEHSLKNITAALNRNPTSDGNAADEVIIENAQITINIFDPLSQRMICALPARGEDCRHRECFDLTIFLQSRTREFPTWPSEVDAWRCPICRGDVRPHKMVIDGFLQQVGEQLVKEGKARTKAIMVEADGHWTPKVEELNGSERSTPDEDDVASRASAKPVTDPTSPPRSVEPPKKRVEVIILDDD